MYEKRLDLTFYHVNGRREKGVSRFCVLPYYPIWSPPYNGQKDRETFVEVNKLKI